MSREKSIVVNTLLSSFLNLNCVIIVVLVLFPVNISVIEDVLSCTFVTFVAQHGAQAQLTEFRLIAPRATWPKLRILGAGHLLVLFAVNISVIEDVLSCTFVTFVAQRGA